MNFLGQFRKVEMLTQKNGQVVAGPSVGAFLHPSGIRLYLRSLWGKIKKGIEGYFVNDTWVDKKGEIGRGH